MQLTQKIPSRSEPNQHKAALPGRPGCGIPDYFPLEPVLLSVAQATGDDSPRS